MFPSFAPRHIPGLIVASTMTFGGMWAFLNTQAAMLEFGFPARIAEAPAAAPVKVVGQARGTVIGLLVFTFYSRSQFDQVDLAMAVTGTYCGLVDSYVVWKEGNPRKALFRLVTSGLLAAWGWAGWTSP
ncbi:hypothetical protein KVR01_009091 [Diaporthe batatas]|uniref:uncharacterized protein n=1 Tax=Diaporthe batatas TaxID=748121 RepID=UPI001D03C757|nr:uncharacterized protein KVR01_009091 [Diaporthe batatas]KAG8160827.1 hypothetical protein KVR01_009091 [Diaporthe batatas]